MLAKVDSASLLGLDASPVHVEVNLANGMPSFSIVGLPDAATRESKDRVGAAIRNSGFKFPSKRLTVNLAPAELKKEGSAFDLAIAVGILLASETVIPKVWPRAVWLGELALDGAIRPVRGMLATARSLNKKGYQTFIIPAKNAADVKFLTDVRILPFGQLIDIVRWLTGEGPAPETSHSAVWQPALPPTDVDISEVKGQSAAKRALEIAAAGNHNLLMVGTPGTGKSMLAQVLPSILPPWTLEEAIEASQVHSLIQPFHQSGMLPTRPFRSPHHSVSSIALVGGGDMPLPGEISLSHNGVLFMDEFPEFRRDALEALRQPLESGKIHVQRVRGRATFPANFLLVAAMNPCPCGQRGHPTRECICPEWRVQRYFGRVSAPLLDRMDLQIELRPLDTQTLLNDAVVGETSEVVRHRVEAARDRQRRRLHQGETTVAYNSRLRGVDLRRICPLSDASKSLLQAAVDRLGLSARAFDRIRRVARTLADLEDQANVSDSHIGEAIQYRALDRAAQPF